MPPRVDNSTGWSSTANFFTLTLGYNNTTRGLLGLIGWVNANLYADLLSATFNGVAMTRAVVIGGSRDYYEFWYLENAPIGTHNLVFTVRPGSEGGCYNVHAISLGEVDFASLVRTVESANVGTGLGVSDTITGINPGDLIVSLGGHSKGLEATLDNVGQTSIHHLNTGANDFPDSLSTVSSWTLATGTTENEGVTWATQAYGGISIAAIRPRGAGNQVVWMMSKIHDFFKDLREGLIPPEELQHRYRGLKNQGLLTI